MTHRLPPGRGLNEIDDEEEVDEEEPQSFTTSVISAEGAFRVVLVLLTAWTLFEGFALATGAISAVDAGTDRTAERMLGGLMIVLGGVYAMIAWQRQRYRLLLWVPFAAQIAIVVPLSFSFDADRILLLVISSIFLVLMVYVWSRRNRHAQMNFLGLFNFTAPYLPWVLLAFSMALGSSPAVDLRGTRLWIVRPEFAAERLGTPLMWSRQPTPVGVSIGIRDLDAARSLLTENKVRFQPFGRRSILIGPSAARGVHLEFIEAAT